MKIPFHKPYLTGRELTYIKEAVTKRQGIAGDGDYTKKVQSYLEKLYGVKKVVLTTSGTTALEIAVRLLDLPEDSEVIAPSFTFSSSINAILLSGKLKVVFADIQENTLNIDPDDIKKKITAKTKALMVVHYAGVACDMSAILGLADKYGLRIIEDAAQCIESRYNNRYLGTMGDFGCVSFHETKNITMGEGGALFINTDKADILEKIEKLVEKGTNRSQFIRGEIDRYTWVDIGSSCLPSDILAAYLLAQLEKVKEITAGRKAIYDYYSQKLAPYEKTGLLKLPSIPPYSRHNAHIFYMLFRSESDRNYVLESLRKYGIQATFHFIPLHSSPYGIKLGNHIGSLPVTESVSGRLLRLPLYAGMRNDEKKYVVKVMHIILKRLARHYQFSRYTDYENSHRWHTGL